MEFEANMVTKDGRKMLYLIALGVKENCPDYDAIWEELNKRMNRVSIPIRRVDWLLYDDEGQAYNYGEYLFYAETFEIATGYIMGILDVPNIRRNLEHCDFFSGDSRKTDFKYYELLITLKSYKESFERRYPDKVW